MGRLDVEGFEEGDLGTGEARAGLALIAMTIVAATGAFGGSGRGGGEDGGEVGCGWGRT